eukprot:TRINITY_DN5450_c0_g1_i1.p1 TRINITY_DN5450_c0_g1~~TRINITY_DN5450_c0_g1_i1.p1  ORF type:complete len:455 (+),score=143.47 TRINITY_DN5450_c0_g1_i1:141-1505(+)
MTETTEELNVGPLQSHGLSIMHIKLNEVVLKKLASGLAPASIVFNGLKATLNVGGESYTVQVSNVQPRKQVCLGVDPDKENAVQQLGWVEKRLQVQTALSHSVKERMKQYWREEEQKEKSAQNTAKFIDSRADLRKEHFKSMEEAKKKASANPKPVEKRREIKTVQIRKEETRVSNGRAVPPITKTAPDVKPERTAQKRKSVSPPRSSDLVVKREDKRRTEDSEPPRKRPRSNSPKKDDPAPVPSVKPSVAPQPPRPQPSHSNGRSDGTSAPRSLDPSRDDPARRERSKSAIQSTNSSRTMSSASNGDSSASNSASRGRSASSVGASSGGFEPLDAIDLDAPLSDVDTTKEIESIEQFIKYNGAWDSKYNMYIKLYKQLDKNKKQIDQLTEDYSTASEEQRQRTAEQVKNLYIERNQVVQNMRVKYEQLHGELTDLKAKINSFIAKEIEKQYTK